MADAGRGRRRRRAGDAAADGSLDVLICPRCSGGLSSTEDGLVCSKRHRFEAVDGVFDLWPADRPVPRGDPFSGPYGEVYDRAIKERWLARVGGRLGWGADVGAMFRLMDEGVKCAPGEVVLDVPIGGGPSLRAAAGRMEGTLIGIDLSLAMLHRATEVVHEERLERVVLARGDATRLPIASASVDRILCFNGLHVLPNKREALAEFQRVLKPGGEVWGSVVVKHPTARWARPWFNAAWWFFHPADPGELDRLAEQTGFKRWETERSGSLMLFRGRRSNKPATGLKKR